MNGVVEFPDNRLLIDLCGEYDRNLAEIENQKLGVQILRRGNQLARSGRGTGSAEAASQVLQCRFMSGWKRASER